MTGAAASNLEPQHHSAGSRTIQETEDEGGSSTVTNPPHISPNGTSETHEVATGSGNVPEDELDTEPYGNSADDDGLVCEGDGNEGNEPEFQSGDLDDEQDYGNENDDDNENDNDNNDDDDDHDVDYDDDDDNGQDYSEDKYRTLYIETRAYLISVLKKKFKIPLSIGPQTQALYNNQTLTVSQLELLREQYCAMLGDEVLNVETDSGTSGERTPLPSTPQRIVHPVKTEVTTPPKKKAVAVTKAHIKTSEDIQVSLTFIPLSQCITNDLSEQYTAKVGHCET